MMMNEDDTFTVSMTIENSNSMVTKQFTVPYDESWTGVIAQLADGVSAHYGYNVKENIRFLVTYPDCHHGSARELCVHKHDFESFMEEQDNL